MKKLVILTITIFIIFLIYNFFNNNKINYVSISDHSIINTKNYNDYINNYLTTNNRLSSFIDNFINKDAYSLYNDLINNRTIRVNNNDLYFKKVLRESDIVVINVGMEEIVSKFDKYDIDKNSDLLSKIYLNIEKLVSETRKYAFGTVILIGPYNPYSYYDASIDELFFYMDSKLENLSKNNSIHYIKMYELIKSSIGNKSLIYQNIANIIKKYIK